MINPTYLFALSASACFAGASTTYARFSRQTSAAWMNLVKALIAAFCFAIASFAVGDFHRANLPLAAGLKFLFSGALGLGVGDTFLLAAFTTIGAARTLMIYSFQPVFIGIGSYIMFGQTLGLTQGVAILFLIACTFTISYERYRVAGHWEIRGILFAVLGVILDNIGILFTRSGFDQATGLSSFGGNLVRAIGAILVLAILNPKTTRRLSATFMSLSIKDRKISVFASIIGSFFSLSCWLAAIKYGHLATVAALGGVTPIFATLAECIHEKHWPTRGLIIALGFFIVGFAIMSLT